MNRSPAGGPDTGGCPDRPAIVLIGMNHETADVELRECIAFSDEEAKSALAEIRMNEAVRELVIISTCNRVEILMAARDPDAAVAAAKSYLCETRKVPACDLDDATYVRSGENAVRHVFRVAASLDSMMVGEPQILGQIKDAYRIAADTRATGVILNSILHRTFFVAKRVRSETRIGDHAVSISYAAVELAKKIFGELDGKAVLLVGAGEMAELAVEHLIRNRAADIRVANRTFERGVALAGRFNGRAIRFEEIPDTLAEADIIISSTGSPGFVIRPEHVTAVRRSRKNRPLFFIDIAVPRDVDPAVNRLNNAYVYDIDDLKDVIEENVEERKREAVKGERIVDEAVIRFRHWYETLDVVPTIVSLREKLSTIADAETKKTFHSLKHLSGEDRAAVRRMAEAMVNKILHDPTLYLKRNGFHGDKSQYLDMLKKLFKLDDSERNDN